jgi:quercetin dioxygenase-like cupin family protein
VFYVLEGECLIFFDGKEFLAKPGNAFICEPGDKHNLWNKSKKEFKLVVFKINFPEKDDTTWLKS